jgi:hypothetical protein
MNLSTWGNLAKTAGKVISSLLFVKQITVEGESAGSIFGLPVEATSVLGCSTSPTSWNISVASFAGGSVIIASLVGIYVYTRKRRNVIEQIIVEEHLAL